MRKQKLHSERSRERRYAVLVVDMLNDFVYGKLKCANAKKIIPKIQSVLETTESIGIPVFFCNDAHKKEDRYEFRLWGPHAIEGTRGAKLIKEIKPSQIDCVVPKRTYSAFYKTNLESLLRKNFGKKGPDGVIIYGIHTNICAKHTAYDAFVRGFDVLVAEDGVTAFTDKDHRFGLDYMRRNYGAKILKTREIIRLLKKTQSRN
ncbi:MAG TPA: isochorismatase family cysteine hydrolase [Candidatus Nitrosotalea sp.]|nr:isochorismatase family cysteine hydrolase [Candidatus Nitrosotalea sp.]